MSHTWKANTWEGHDRNRKKKRKLTRIRQLSTNQRAGFDVEVSPEQVEEVRTLVEEMRSQGIPIPRLRDERERKPTGELRYEAVGGDS